MSTTTNPEPEPSEDAGVAEIHVLHKADRSRIVLGQTTCEHARFLAYHSENGYGITLRATDVPMASGIRIHECLAEIVKTRINAPLADRSIYRGLIHHASDAYAAHAHRVGIQELEELGVDDAAIAERKWTILEQQSIIEGLLWAFIQVQLEWLVTNFDIISVEQEEAFASGCTCGLGDYVGTEEDHEQRGCLGVLFMARPDLIGRRKGDKKLVGLDFKTSGWLWDKRWRDTFEDNVQFSLGTLAASNRLNEPVDEHYVIALDRGKRQHPLIPGTRQVDHTQPKRSSSWLAYAYYRPPNPPFQEADWQLHYTYTDEDGKTRYATSKKGYGKIPIFEASLSQDPAIRDAEAWVDMRDVEELEKLFDVIGPYPTKRALSERYVTGLVQNERYWIERLNTLREQELTIEEYDAEIARLFPQSWDCRGFGRKCPFLDRICKEGTYGNPLENGFKLRRPHHEPEIREMERFGVEVPAPDDEDEE